MTCGERKAARMMRSRCFTSRSHGQWDLQVWLRKGRRSQSRQFDGNYLLARQLDDYIAIVELNGKDVYLDPAEDVLLGTRDALETFAGRWFPPD